MLDLLGIRARSQDAGDEAGIFHEKLGLLGLKKRSHSQDRGTVNRSVDYRRNRVWLPRRLTPGNPQVESRDSTHN